MSTTKASVVQPSSVLGFGAALTLLDDDTEIARLLAESLAAVVPAKLTAVALYALDAPPDEASSGTDTVLVGQRDAEPLDDASAEDLRCMIAQHRTAARSAPQAERGLSIDGDPYPALDARGIDRCTLIRLGTVEQEFGVILLGTSARASHAASHVTAAQLLAAQASLALHRARLKRQRETKAEALQESQEALRAARDELETQVEKRTAALRQANAELRAEVAERQEAEETKARQLSAMEAATVGMSIHDADGTFRYANPAHAATYGYDSAAELVGESWEMLYDDEQVRYIKQHVIPEIAQGRRWSGELVGRKKSGEPFDVHLSLAPLDDGGLACICQDITERKASKQALRRYANRLEILRTIDRAILAAESPSEIAAEAMRRVQQFLPALRSSVALFDWSADEAEILALHQESASALESGVTIPISEMNLADSMHEGQAHVVHDLDALDDVRDVPAKLQKEGVRSYLSVPMIVEDELIGVVNVGAAEPGAFTAHFQEIVREVADQLAIAIRQARLMEQVQRHSERMEQRVKERTEELESFTYSVSHDLRTPLRAVDGFARMLLESRAEQLDAEGRRMLEVIHENAQKMGQLIEDLLALSRLGRRELRRGRVDMEALVAEVYAEVRPEGRAVQFDLQALPPAEGDRTMLRRVVENLLANAVKFTQEEAAPRIEVGARRRSDGAVVYYVRDNGAGFDGAYAEKMFGVFQRLHDEEEFAGTGVGLAIVERVMRRHGGAVWAEGEEGEGATVYFCVSCAQEGAADASA
jgi:PAS domain S-box-containing protein